MVKMMDKKMMDKWEPKKMETPKKTEVKEEEGKLKTQAGFVTDVGTAAVKQRPTVGYYFLRDAMARRHLIFLQFLMFY